MKSKREHITGSARDVDKINTALSGAHLGKQQREELEAELRQALQRNFESARYGPN